MIVNGNDKVGEARAYKTPLELAQALKIVELERYLWAAQILIRDALTEVVPLPEIRNRIELLANKIRGE